jgi:hypothetical protein
LGLVAIARRHIINLRTLLSECEMLVWRQHTRDVDLGRVSGEIDRVVFDLDEVIAWRPQAALVTNPALEHIETAIALARAGRRHEGQLNKQLTSDGWVGVDYQVSMLKEWDIEGRWQVFGTEQANEVVSYVEENITRGAAIGFAVNLADLRIRSALRVLRKVWSRPGFWHKMPVFLVRKLRQDFIDRIRYLVPVSIRRALKSLLQKSSL